MQPVLRRLFVRGLLMAAFLCPAQELHLQIAYAGKVPSPMTPAVVWLKPLQPIGPVPAAPRKTYTLAQKNRQFIPHLLVVPVGSEVMFPNEDPFYHNVFSLFDGKRFDLGLYEAGSSKTVTFSREGVSYIFCNIHPEMSAVVVAVSTPFFATPNASGLAIFRDVPPGEYELHAWAEGVPQPILDRLTHRVRVTAEQSDLGQLTMPALPARASTHLNKFGQPYDRNSKTPY
jgi:plastocyanin